MSTNAPVRPRLGTGDPDLVAIVHRLGNEILGDDLEARFAEGRPNPEALPAMARSGLLGLTLHPRYGGLGRDYAALATVCEELGRIDLAYQIGVTVHLALTGMTILQWGTAAQRAAWLPSLARGERLATFALTEPGAGSDAAAIVTRAVRDGDGYRLNGEKTWISGANDASLFLVFATLDPAARHAGLIACLVPRETPGLTTTRLEGKLGVRAGDTGSVVLDDARVRPEGVLGEPGEGFPIALSALDDGLFTVAAGALGIAAESIDQTEAFLRTLGEGRIRAGRDQLFAAHIAAMASGETRARLLLVRAAALKNRGLPSQRATSLAKWTAARAARDAAEAALTIHQTYAVGPHPTQERHLRNARGAMIYGGTDEIHQTMQAAYALGDRTERPFRRPSPTAADLAGAGRASG